MEKQRIQAYFGMEIKKLLKQPLNLFFSLLFGAMLMVLLGLALGNLYGWYEGPNEHGYQMSIFEQMIPGLIAYAGILVTMHVGVSVTADRAGGVQRRLDTTPLTSSEVVVSQLLAFTVIPIISTAILLATIAIMGYWPRLNVGGVALVFVFTILLNFVSVGFGLITSILAKKPDVASSLAFIFILPQQLFGTFIYMGDFSAAVNPYMPSWYAADAIYRLFYWPSSAAMHILKDFVVLAIIAVVVLLIGIKLHAWYKKTHV